MAYQNNTLSKGNRIIHSKEESGIYDVGKRVKQFEIEEVVEEGGCTYVSGLVSVSEDEHENDSCQTKKATAVEDKD